jgi:hypothetical protein
MPHRLKLDPDFSEYQIFGLSTHLKDYKLCWHINKALQQNLIRYPALSVPESEQLLYSLFVHREAYEQIDLYLLSNFSNHVPWFVKAKHFHYFFIIGGSPLNSLIVEIEKNLKMIPQMLLVTRLSAGERKLAQPLLTDFELHLTQVSSMEKELLKDKSSQKDGFITYDEEKDHQIENL